MLFGDKTTVSIYDGASTRSDLQTVSARRQRKISVMIWGASDTTVWAQIHVQRKMAL